MKIVNLALLSEIERTTKGYLETRKVNCTFFA